MEKEILSEWVGEVFPATSLYGDFVFLGGEIASSGHSLVILCVSCSGMPLEYGEGETPRSAERWREDAGSDKKRGERGKQSRSGMRLRE